MHYYENLWDFYEVEATGGKGNGHWIDCTEYLTNKQKLVLFAS